MIKKRGKENSSKPSAREYFSYTIFHSSKNHPRFSLCLSTKPTPNRCPSALFHPVFFRSPIRFTLVVPSPFLFPSPSIGQAVHPSPLSLFFFSPGCSLSLSPASENEKTLAFFTCSSTTKTPLPPRSVSSWQRDGAGGRDTKSRCFAKERKRDARDEIITRKGSHGRFVLIPMRGNARYAADNIPRNAFNAGGTRMRWHTV